MDQKEDIYDDFKLKKAIWLRLFLQIIVFPTVEDGPKWKLAFPYPVIHFSSDFNEIW